MTIGKIFLNDAGEIESTAGGTFRLLWNPEEAGYIIIENSHPSFPCNYWYKPSSEGGGSGIVAKGDKIPIISNTNIENEGFEVHFGQADGTSGWCSVWLQYFNGKLVGHYMKY
jgi:hypothetical protein